jgi:uncharacterized protein YecT (DUF1311 family)
MTDDWYFLIKAVQTFEIAFYFRETFQVFFYKIPIPFIKFHNLITKTWKVCPAKKSLNSFIMKHIPVILLLLCCFAMQAQKNPTKKKLNCNSAKLSQGELNDCAALAYEEVQTTLDSVYKAILNNYRSDTVFIHNLRTAEALWLKLRDAELEVKFPDMPNVWYGSVQPMCESMYLTDLTTQRTTFLRQWLDGTEEGDVCSGSVKIK